jgi:hypothetical protein
MWFMFGLVVAALLLALWCYTPGTWPFNSEKFRKAGESRADWEKRLEEMNG